MNSGANSVAAGAGDDQVSYTLGGANTLDGGARTDRLRVYMSDEGGRFDAAQGTDGNGSRLTGFELFTVKGGETGDSVVTLGAGEDRFQEFSDTFDSGQPGGDERVRGGGGVDDLSGGDGRDTLHGDAGNDRLYGENDADVLFGGIGDDTLGGAHGMDSLYGGAGNDRLDGGDGFGRLVGGAGRDTFIFVSLSERGHERIVDFASGVDRIGIGFDVAGWMRGSLPAALLREGAPQGTAAQFLLIDEGAQDRLLFDANGTGVGGRVTLAILEGESGLTATDILLIA